MAKVNIYTVRDVISDTYGRPFYSTNDETAVRSLAMEVNSGVEDSVLATNPDDFELYLLGEYDDSTASFDIHDSIKFIVRASNLLKSD